jgi:hypothetical protein
MDTEIPAAEEELSRRWRAEGEQYASAMNAFVARAMKGEWENVAADSEPQGARQAMAEAVLEAVRRANGFGLFDGVRDRFPPAPR